ncbi:MAG: outer membrane lipoprotein-sorting protein, partial [Spirochaetales bacterium]|nr:outer membrane lipoprotein-sorting protein [Spirochaetales bacterium]
MKRMLTSLILVLFTCSLVLAAVPAGHVMAKVMEIQSSDTAA